MTTYVIGIDCAAQHRNIGLALGRIDGARVCIQEVVTGPADVVPVLARWALKFQPGIYALDAPLGWPAALGKALNSHEAGATLGPTSHELFRRMTDDFVYAKLGKRPLEVGADRIARAAVTTLKLLERLERETGMALPLLWNPGIPEAPGAIEVYPAATLLARRISIRGYKGRKPEHRRAREALAGRLGEHLEFEVDPATLAATDHALDAAVCVLAAADFAERRAMSPDGRDDGRLRKEGWIWFADGAFLAGHAGTVADRS